MKAKLFILCAMVAVSISSCDLLNDLIPDVDTSYSKTFLVDIGTNSGETDVELIDVTTSDEYNDFKDNIKGFTINKITYQVLDNNTPDDMQMSGSIVCSNIDGTESVSVGLISPVSIKAVADSGSEYDAENVAEGINKVTSWLDDPGKFNMKTSYSLRLDTGAGYPLTGEENYSFSLKIKVYVTVLTGA